MSKRARVSLLLGWSLVASSNVAPARQAAPDTPPAAVQAVDVVLEQAMPTTLSGDASSDRGACALFRHVARSDCVLAAYALSDEVDLRLAMEAPDGSTMAMDDDSGGGRTPFVQALVKRGTELRLRVLGVGSSPTARTSLWVTESPDDERTLAAAHRMTDASGRAGQASKEQRLAECREALGSAIAIYEAEAGAPASAAMNKIMWEVGMQAWAAADLEVAQRSFDATLRSRSRVFPPTHPDVLAALLNRSACAFRLGRLEEAAGGLEEVLAIRSRILPEDHQDLQGVRLNLGGALMKLGRLQQARALLQKAYDVLSRTLPEDHTYVQAARVNLAGTIKALGDFAAARVLEEQAVAVYERSQPDDHPDLQRARMNLAMTQCSLGALPEARALLERILGIRRRALPPDHTDILLTQEALALAEDRLGNHQRSMQLREEVLEAYARTVPRTNRDFLAAQANQAVEVLRLGDPERSRRLLEDALTDLSSVVPEESGNITSVCINLALVLVRCGDQAALRNCVRKLARSTRKRLIRDAVSLPPRQAQASGAMASEEISLVLSMTRGTARSAPITEENGEAFALIETARSLGLVSARAMHRAETAGESSQVRELRDRVRGLCEEISGSAAVGNDPETLTELIRQKEAAEQALLDQVRDADAQIRTSTLADAAAVARLLRPEDVVVSFWRYQRTDVGDSVESEEVTDSLLAFVLEAGGRLTRFELGPMPWVDRATREWRARLSIASETGGRGVSVSEPGAATQDERSAGESLRHLVLDPLWSILAHKRRWIVAADDALHLVPIDALPLNSDVIGDRFEVLRIATLADLSSAQSTFDAPPAILAYGGIDYGDAGGLPEVASTLAPAEPPQHDLVRSGPWKDGFPQLLATETEARGIVDLFRSVHGAQAHAWLLTGHGATKAALFERTPGVRFLHLATHGFFAADPGRNSSADAQQGRAPEASRTSGLAPGTLCGLALAGANAKPDELGRLRGVVTAEELSALDLRACELAVLSACDTSVGIQQAGQGVASLQTALAAAGARATLTSLWRVSDESTRDLMLDFYRRVWVEKQAMNRALWEAKQTLRRRGEPVRAWAGWILCGGPD